MNHEPHEKHEKILFKEESYAIQGACSIPAPIQKQWLKDLFYNPFVLFVPFVVKPGKSR